MPFARPTLTQLQNTAVQDITSSGVPGLDGLLRNAVLRVLSWVMAGLAFSVYGYVDWIAREGVPFTATDEHLEAWAALIGIYRKDATPASGTASYIGQPGLVLRTGTPLRRQDATPYVTTEERVVDSTGTLLVPFVAEVDGAATDCDPGTPMSIASGVPGINSNGVTVGQTIGGSDQETDASLRSRMLAKYRSPPQGGSASDYEIWALEVAGVTRAFVQPNGLGPGTVIVRPMFDDTEAAHGGFPQGKDGCAVEETRGPTATGDQLLVAEHIWPMQPVTALVYVMAPVAAPIDVHLVALDPNTEDTRTQIVGSLNDMFLVRATLGGTIYPSDLYDAILATPGVHHFTMSAPTMPITADAGALPVLGAFTVQNATA